MKTLPFYIVDVFAETPYAGNQLAVFRHAQQLLTVEMQAIAREIHFSETTFILSDAPRENGFDVRIFTPRAEVPFAGHPTLGTAFIVKEHILKKNVPQVNLNLKVGQIPVELLYMDGNLNDLWMKQIDPIFGETLSAAEVAPILGIPEAAIDATFPIQRVSTGLPYYIVPLKDLNTMRQVCIDPRRYEAFLKHRQYPPTPPQGEDTLGSAFFVFCPETYHAENDFNTRMFDDYYGVPEDAATGSANGCFLAYLLKYGYFGQTKLDLRVEQGYEIERPSLVRIRGALQKDGGFDIFVGGKVQMIAEGSWYRH